MTIQRRNIANCDIQSWYAGFHQNCHQFNQTLTLGVTSSPSIFFSHEMLGTLASNDSHLQHKSNKRCFNLVPCSTRCRVTLCSGELCQVCGLSRRCWKLVGNFRVCLVSSLGQRVPSLTHQRIFSSLAERQVGDLYLNPTHADRLREQSIDKQVVLVLIQKITTAKSTFGEIVLLSGDDWRGWSVELLINNCSFSSVLLLLWFFCRMIATAIKGVAKVFLAFLRIHHRSASIYASTENESR